MAGQMTLFNLMDDTPDLYKIHNKVRLIELFAGIGSQAMALKRLGVDFEHYRCVEYNKYPVMSYNAIHGTDFKPTDITKLSGEDLGIVDTDKYTYIMTYSFPCFVGKTMVLTNNGYKKIKDIKIGDYVLTHNNTYEKVIASKSTGVKATYILKGMCFDEIECTDNHKFYVRKMVRHYTTNKNSKRGSVREFLTPEWVQCKDLDKSYYMGIAINQNAIIPEWNGIDFEWTDGRKNRHKNELTSKLNNKDFWWLIGRYVGDGWHRKQGGIIICCAEEETSEITSVADSLSIHYSISKEKTVNKIHFPDKELELFVEPFGRGAENKQIPGFVFDLPIDLLRGFIEGYVSADGTYTQGRFKTTSVSKMLTYGIAQCVAKAYNTPFSIYKNKMNPRTTIQGREVNQKDFYQLCWKTEKKNQDKAFYEDGYIWFPITNIEPTYKKERVYDIEVENSHSFTANGVIAHNCQDLSLAGKQKGMSKDSGTRSGLLWEVERLLNECKELPQILLMENVIQVHDDKNINDFEKWREYLTDKGYTNFLQDLNAKNYGVAQSRTRAYMVSILGNANYVFPEPINLKYVMEDYLQDESEIEDKYYLKSKKVTDFLQKLKDEDKLNNV